MRYADFERALASGRSIILDGGVGTELERRGASMDPDAWCGPASRDNADLLTRIHLDYIEAGAEIITANTYASSRLMLEPAGFGHEVAHINRIAVEAALRARDASGRDDVLVAGSLSPMCPIDRGTDRFDPSRLPPAATLERAFEELAGILRSSGCDLIICEMLYDRVRAPRVLDAALSSGLPVWAGFSARRGADGGVLAFDPHEETPFSEITGLLKGRKLEAAGVMHTPSDLVGSALDVLRRDFDGPLVAYPDSGHFRMPHWQFEDVIPPADFATHARRWRATGVQVVGGCCGLSPAHIEALVAGASHPH